LNTHNPPPYIIEVLIMNGSSSSYHEIEFLHDNKTFNSSNFTYEGEPCADLGSDYKLFEFWSNGILLNVVGVLGILGNVLSMIILSRPQMRSSINYLLIGLARCDIVLIVMSILLFGIPAIYPYTGYLRFYYLRIVPAISEIGFFIALSAQTASVSKLRNVISSIRFLMIC
jgi:Serpentine type 7TM GPCR chemoreceptor Srw